MKKLALAFALVIASLSASAQEATLTTPVSRPSESKMTLNRFDCDFLANQCVVSVDVKETGGTIIRTFSVMIPRAANPGATFTGILSAAGTTRASETGGAERRANFRIMGYLLDQGYISGVTLVP